MKRLRLWFLLFWLIPQAAHAVRLKDIAYLKGVRDNQLSGFGIIIGLSGTGDQKLDLTESSLNMMLKGLGVDLRTQKVQSKNAASVICSAVLPPFARVGSQIDVTVSSIASATSLDGGILMMTPLKGPDGQVYAMAQGKVLTIKRGSSAGAITTGQTLVTATIPRGAILEREIAFNFSDQKELHYYLLNPDFTTAARIARRINEELSGRYATATDAGGVHVLFPYGFQGSATELVAQIEGIEIEADRRAKVVINQRTGTVVLGEQVRISPVAIAHNNLRMEVKKENRDLAAAGAATDPNANPANPNAAPASAAAGTGAPEETKPVNSTPQGQRLMVLSQSTTIADIVASLNDLGASPDDLVSMLQALRAAGALSAEIEMQ